MKQQLTVINIDWERIHFNEEEIQKLNGSSDYGIYQIYGHHPAYGDNSLLYIGKASENRFAGRLGERNEFKESVARPQFILIGRFICSTDDTEELGWDLGAWGAMIDVVETMLIKTHTPAFNKQNNSGLLPKEISDEGYLIINWGDFGRLLPEISSLRQSYKYWNFERHISEEQWDEVQKQRGASTT